MGKTRDGDIAVKAQVVALNLQKFSNSAIATAVNRSRCFVINTLKRHRETGSFASRKQSGRPSLSTQRTDRVLRRFVNLSPTATTAAIRDAVGAHLHRQPSFRTIRRILVQRLSLRAYRPTRKPLLTVQQRQRRIEFCRTHLNWTESFVL